MEIKFAFYKAYEAPGKTWYDWVIAKWTRGPYSHVELIVDDMMYSSSPRDGHVRSKKHKYDPATWDYIPVTITIKDYKRFIKFWNQTESFKYDWLGILGFVLPLHDDPKKYFCSEWTSKAGIIMGINCLYIKEPSRLSPNKLAKTLIENGYKIENKG